MEAFSANFLSLPRGAARCAVVSSEFQLGCVASKVSRTRAVTRRMREMSSSDQLGQ